MANEHEVEPLPLDTDTEPEEERDEVAEPEDGAEEAKTAKIKKRFAINMLANKEKFDIIMLTMERWFEENGIKSELDKRTAIVEMAIDMLYAKPEIAEMIGREELDKLLSRGVKRFL